MKSILVLELCAFFPHFEAQAFIPVEHLHSIIFGDCRVYWTSMIGKKIWLLFPKIGVWCLPPKMDG